MTSSDKSQEHFAMPPGGRKWRFSITFDSEGNQLCKCNICMHTVTLLDVRNIHHFEKPHYSVRVKNHILSFVT